MSLLVAAFPSAGTLMAAVHRVTTMVPPDQIEAYTPYPLDELDDLLRIPRSRTPRWALAGGLSGFGIAAIGQWWITAIAYPLNVGARPINPIPAYVPVVFELTILGVATCSLLGLLWECGLPRLWHPMFEVDGFERATQDLFFLRVECVDPSPMEAVLRECGARSVTSC